MKTAYLISCSDHYSHRLWLADQFLKSRGYDVTYLTSDFDHTGKKTFTCSVPGAVQLHALPYQKNLSFDRIRSHRRFARDAFRYLEELPREPDAVIAMLPPNFLAKYGAAYKKRHPQVRLIFDIFDMWPETFPFGKAKKLLAPAFAVWASIRDRYLPAADFVTTECQLFRTLLRLPEEKSGVIYLSGREIPLLEPVLSEERLELCYLGAINNVIGISEISQLIRELSGKKPVRLHIIGKGERQQELQDAAKAAGAEVIFYGPVYDDQKKQEIMSRCHFGLNIMKSSVCVGLTMKSMDYFAHGLPILNNIPADTEEFVRQRGVGIQVEAGAADKIAALTASECLQMRKNVKIMEQELFRTDRILRRYEEVLSFL